MPSRDVYSIMDRCSYADALKVKQNTSIKHIYSESWSKLVDPTRPIIQSILIANHILLMKNTYSPEMCNLSSKPTINSLWNLKLHQLSSSAPNKKQTKSDTQCLKGVNVETYLILHNHVREQRLSTWQNTISAPISRVELTEKQKNNILWLNDNSKSPVNMKKLKFGSREKFERFLNNRNNCRIRISFKDRYIKYIPDTLKDDYYCRILNIGDLVLNEPEKMSRDSQGIDYSESLFSFDSDSYEEEISVQCSKNYSFIDNLEYGYNHILSKSLSFDDASNVDKTSFADSGYFTPDSTSSVRASKKNVSLVRRSHIRRPSRNKKSQSVS